MARPIEGQMRKNNYSFTLDPELVIKLRKKAGAEVQSASELVNSILSEWLQAHGEGNPNYQLDKFGNGFKAYPAIWGKISATELSEYSPEDIEEMLSKAQAFVETIKKLKPNIERGRDEIMVDALKREDHLKQVLKALSKSLEKEPKSESFIFQAHKYEDEIIRTRNKINKMREEDGLPPIEFERPATVVPPFEKINQLVQTMRLNQDFLNSGNYDNSARKLVIQTSINLAREEYLKLGGMKKFLDEDLQ